MVCFLSLGRGVSVSGLAVCDSLVGVTASAEKQFVQPLSPQLVIDKAGRLSSHHLLKLVKVISLALPDAASV